MTLKRSRSALTYNDELLPVSKTNISPALQRLSMSPVPPLSPPPILELSSDSIDLRQWYRQLEIKRYVNGTHVVTSINAITTKMFPILMEWLVNVNAEIGNSQRQILYISQSFVHRLLLHPIHSCFINCTNFQCYGIACFSLASKSVYQNDYKQIEIYKLYASCAEDTYSYTDIIDTENKIVAALEWNLLTATMYDWISFYVKELKIIAKDNLSQHDHMWLLADLLMITNEPAISVHYGSAMAASIVLLFFPTTRCHIEYISGYSHEYLIKLHSLVKLYVPMDWSDMKCDPDPSVLIYHANNYLHILERYDCFSDQLSNIQKETTNYNCEINNAPVCRLIKPPQFPINS